MPAVHPSESHWKKTSEQIALQRRRMGDGDRELTRSRSIGQVASVAASPALTIIPGLADIEFVVDDFPVEVVLIIPWMITSTNTADAGILIGDPDNNQLTTIVADDARLKAFAWKKMNTGYTDFMSCSELVTTPGTHIRRGFFSKFAGTGTLKMGTAADTWPPAPSELIATEKRI